MGYNQRNYVRKAGTGIYLEPAYGSHPQVKLITGSYVAIIANGTSNIRFQKGTTAIFRMDYAGNVTTVEGGNVTGDDLVLKANTVDAGPVINLVGNGNITLIPASGSHTQFGTHVATGDAVSDGSISIKDAGGTIRKLMTKA